jgi:hypothetical protein
MKKILFLLLLLITFTANAQIKFISKAFDFEINFPAGWTEGSAESFPDKELSGKEQYALLQKEKYIYINDFYDLKASLNNSDLIPKVQFSAIYKREKTFEAFKKEAIRGTKLLKLEDLHFILEPSEIMIGDIKGIYFKFHYLFEVRGKKLRGRNTTYAVPYRDYLIWISMVDGFEQDRTAFFDEIIKSFKVHR